MKFQTALEATNQFPHELNLHPFNKQKTTNKPPTDSMFQSHFDHNLFQHPLGLWSLGLP